MALAKYKSDLNLLLQAMLAEGIVNDRFLHLQTVKEVQKDYVIRTVCVYCAAVKNLFILMSTLLEQSAVDFIAVELHACDLFDRSYSIGADLVRVACLHIIYGCRALDKHYCTWALNLTKREVCKLQRNMDMLVQLERNIIDHQAGYEENVPHLHRFI